MNAPRRCQIDHVASVPGAPTGFVESSYSCPVGGMRRGGGVGKAQGKIEGRGTPRRGRAGLHVGWDGTSQDALRAVRLTIQASVMALHRAVSAGVRWSTTRFPS